MARQKEYVAKIYDITGTTFKGNVALTSDPVFLKKVSGGVGEAIFTLALPVDNFGEGDLITFRNELQIWVADDDSPNGIQIYSGHIAEYRPYSNASGEGVQVRVHGYVTRLWGEMYRNGSDFSITHSSQDPETIFKAIIDQYRTNVASNYPRINYTATSTDTVGTSHTYKFEAKHINEALNIVTERLAGPDYYWYIDSDNVANFKQYSTTADHLLTFNREIVAIDINKTLAQCVNHVLFWNGVDPAGIYNVYRNTSSSDAYFHWWEIIVDGRVTVAATAEEISTSKINRYKDPVTSLVITVRDNAYYQGYNIESLNPGDTLRILNLKTNNPLQANMPISKVLYSPGVAQLYIDDIELLTPRILNSLREEITANQSSGLPSGSASVIDV